MKTCSLSKCKNLHIYGREKWHLFFLYFFSPLMIWYAVSFPTYFCALTKICSCMHLYLYILNIYAHIYSIHIIDIILHILFHKPISLLIYHVCVHANSFQWYLTLCSPMDCSLPSSSVRGILQARILEWVAMPSSRWSSQFKD